MTEIEISIQPAFTYLRCSEPVTIAGRNAKRHKIVGLYTTKNIQAILGHYLGQTWEITDIKKHRKIAVNCRDDKPFWMELAPKIGDIKGVEGGEI